MSETVQKGFQTDQCPRVTYANMQLCTKEKGKLQLVM